MLFLSPSVITTEVDQTLFAQEKSNKIGAIAGAFQWGPVDQPRLVTNGENEFVSKYGIPTDSNAKYSMPILDFFGYSNNAWIIRQVGPTALNAFPASKTPLLVKNGDVFSNSVYPSVDFMAKYPGTAGNSLSVSIIDSVSFPSSELASRFTYSPKAGEFAVAVIDTTGYWTGVSAQGQKERVSLSGISTGTSVTVFGIAVTIAVSDTAAQAATKIANNTAIKALFKYITSTDAGNGIAYLDYVELVAGYQSTSRVVTSVSGLVLASTIVQAGTVGGVLETYELLEDSATAKFGDGTTKNWASAINQGSKFIRVGDASITLSARAVKLVGGVDDNVINVASGYALLVNKEAYDVQFLIAPDVTETEQKAIIAIAEARGNCMAFVAPRLNDVVNNRGNEVASVKDWRINRLNMDSTYTFAVDNWGYMFDKYNQVYRWVPTTGSTAGIFARTFVNSDPWISPAGLTRGKYRSYSKMAWSASEDDRNVLYPVGINSIVTFPAEGVVLFGDKTMTQRPSSFGHVNVRWAFIVAKETVAALARQFLFELNDDFTRSQFTNAARPTLRNMKNRRAFEDFELICNSSNNGEEIRVANKVVVRLRIKPLYSINWVILEMSSVLPGVVFTESN